MAMAAIPIAGLAEKGVQASVDLAKSFFAQIALALNQPLLETQWSTTKSTRKGSTTQTSHAAFPAWMVVGIPVGMWLLGIGLHAADTTNEKGNSVKRLELYDRPRFSPEFKLF